MALRVRPWLMRTALALPIISLVLMAMLLGAGCLDASGAIQGFASADLQVPVVNVRPPEQEREPAGLTVGAGTGPGFNLTWSILAPYAGYGGSIEVRLENPGPSDIYVRTLTLEWTEVVAPSTTMEVYRTIPAGTERRLGFLYHQTPETPGDHAYRFEMDLRASQPGILESAGLVVWSEHLVVIDAAQPMHVAAKVTPRNPPVERNQAYYYDRINGLLAPNGAEVQAFAATILDGLPADYDLTSVIRIYDYIVTTIDYESDVGGDNWASPVETIAYPKGDCEDQTFLFVSLIQAIGGTARVYLIDGHAFGALFVGTAAQATEVMRGIEVHYGQDDLPFVTFTDHSGTWLAADTLGSPYLGGLPVETAASTAMEGGWTFTNTTRVISIDITGEVREHWYDDAPEFIKRNPDLFLRNGLILLVVFVFSGATLVWLVFAPRRPRLPAP